MEVTAVLDLLQHLHWINVKKMYNQDINKISSAINFTKTVRGEVGLDIDQRTLTVFYSE